LRALEIRVINIPSRVYKGKKEKEAEETMSKVERTTEMLKNLARDRREMSKGQLKQKFSEAERLKRNLRNSNLPPTKVEEKLSEINTEINSIVNQMGLNKKEKENLMKEVKEEMKKG